MKKAGFILLMILGTFACKKDDIGNGGGPTNNKIKRVDMGNGEVTTFTYDASGRLSQVKMAEPSVTDVFDLTYDNAGKVRQIRQSDGHTFDFSYQNGELTKIDIMDGAEKVAMKTFVYQEVSREVQSIHTFLADDDNNAIMKPFLRCDYDYYNDGRGNARIAKFYLFDESEFKFNPLTVFEYQRYDDKQNPFAELGILSYFFFNTKASNNPIKIVEKDDIGEVLETTEYAYVYAGNRPIRATETTNQTVQRQVLFQY